MNGASDTIDAFHRGGFYIVQPKGRGHRSGMDAMLLAALVADDRAIKVADLGAGAGAAGLAVVCRLQKAQAVLFERSSEMADYARRSMALPENAHVAGRVSVVEADVTLTAKARNDAGLADEVFHHVIMNPPFNDAADRRTPDALKAEAHAMTDGLFERWIRTAGAIMIPGGQLSLIARPESIADIITGCGRRFGGIEITAIHPRKGENAVRILVTAIKGSRARLSLRAPLIMHEEGTHKFSPFVDDLNNGRAAYARLSRSRSR
ncbi:tRNA1(Val) (adenine(37)-N6)-methyltransferase [Rhizobium mongolense]|uniref:tRNA1(Val) A37 N6-methylase TrmN6 n=2 Tax=Rhizobium mongolense TaxID=57676 RepID=A0ABR6IIZ6_9HYPH|nr:methyltransferase [Rhizobium mongolense]MBB4227846.1 tRNA1(Val) A37 N6-methylase TrmN6 [Rhizobium mongolense]TVZ64995.1 tRNA1(Val) A37 N6-methylase TrmN6 [Rhizobium mongolense USDA 1844]